MYLKNHTEIRTEIKGAKITDLTVGIEKTFAALEFPNTTVVHWIEVDTDSYSQMIEDLNLMEVLDSIGHEELMEIPVTVAMNSTRNFAECIENKLPFNVTKDRCEVIFKSLQDIQVLATDLYTRAKQEGITQESDENLLKTIRLTIESYE